MAYPIETGIPYTFTAADGTRAVINDPTDPDHVGYVDGDNPVTGLEGVEIKENADDLTEADGGVHGAFYRGRRPVTFQGVILPIEDPDDRNQKGQRLLRAFGGNLRQMYPNDRSNGNGTLVWQPTGAPEAMYIKARTQVPPRTPGQWVKQFFVGIVAADPRIYGVTPRERVMVASGTPIEPGRTYDRSYDVNYDWGSQIGQIDAVNVGDGIAPVVITVTGPINSPALQNVTTGEELSFNGVLQDGEQLVIDTLARSVTFVGTDGVSSPVGGWLYTPRSLWWGLAPGDNDLRFVGVDGWTNGVTQAAVAYRYTWI